jgi:DNA polymerase-3 subunit delta'
MDFFPSVLGNEETKVRLGQAILRNAFPHAFIIEGPSGCGKHTLALALSAALNCEKKDGLSLPCGVCDNCRRIFKKNFVDIKNLSKKEGRNTIGVEDIRIMKEDIYLSPTESAYKIYIVEEAQTMTPQAQNALLKIFEEPPAGVVIFLLCDSIQQILSTIKSRAQLVRMERLSDEVVKNALLNINEFSSVAAASPDAFTAAIKLSHGSIGRAKEMLSVDGSAELAEERTLVVKLLSLLVPGKEHFPLYSALQELPQKRNEFSRALLMVLDGLRDLILSKYTEHAPILFYTDRSEVSSLASRIGYARLFRFYDAFTDARNKSEKNGNMTAIMAELSAFVTHV